MALNWVAIYNRLFDLINREGESYFSGGRFIAKVRDTAFFREKRPGEVPPTEIIALSREVRDWLRATIVDYPHEALNLTNHISHAVDRARNRFSEAHFGGEAGRWLATYIRDLVNTQIRPLLHFMGN